jgi:anti-sigma regulatory factor (Ser/Thr protein kinase)
MRQQNLPPPLHLGPVPQATVQARQFVRDGLQQLGVGVGVTEAAELGVSELVTNACLHARTAITVALRLVDDVVRIEVSDDSPRQPTQRDAGVMTTTGRGLRLLSAYGSWGVNDPIDGRIGKTIWFQPNAMPDLP